MTAGELLKLGEKLLSDAGIEENRIDAGVLLEYVTGLNRQKIFLNPDHAVEPIDQKRYDAFLTRRAAGEPLQYITGEQSFMGHRFSVGPGVLIPRPETELLAEQAVSYLSGSSHMPSPKKNTEDTKKYSVLDLCTGSGALVCSIAKACPDFSYTASDISEQALKTAAENALALGVDGLVRFVRSDIFDGIEGEAPESKFCLIVTNPPYIRTDELSGLQREIREHEPMLALDGGADGLAFYRRIADGAKKYLIPGGYIMAEIGSDQAEDTLAIFKKAGFTDLQIHQDLAGLDRILLAKYYD